MTRQARADVRDGIATYFGGQYLPDARCYREGPLLPYGLATLRAYVPKRENDADYTVGLAPGRAMGAYAVVYLAETNERREAFGGPTSGWRHRIYAVTLHLYHLATKALAEDAQADVDELLEAAVALIHADRTLGDAVMQAGESTNGIRTFVGTPGYDPAAEHIRTYASVSFDADVYIQA